MTGKEQAEKFSKELTSLRNEIFNIKDKYTPWFIHDTIKQIFINNIEYEKRNKYIKTYMGFDLRKYKNDLSIIQKIQDPIIKTIRKYHNGVIYQGMIQYRRVYNDVIKYSTKSFYDWETTSVFFIDKKNYKLEIVILMKFKNRWYQYTMSKDTINYFQTSGVKFN